MPIIRIEMLTGRTHEQKAQLAKAITEAVVTIGKTKPESTWVVFQDVTKDNWAEGGTLLSDPKS